jgi:hypothetical protein
MIQDPIVDEIHQIREQLLAQHGGDFAAYVASLQQAQQQHPERYASFAQQPVAPHQSLPANRS